MESTEIDPLNDLVESDEPNEDENYLKVEECLIYQSNNVLRRSSFLLGIAKDKEEISTQTMEKIEKMMDIIRNFQGVNDVELFKNLLEGVDSYDLNRFSMDYSENLLTVGKMKC